MSLFKSLVPVLTIFVASTAALADNLAGANAFLCTAVQATQCPSDGEGCTSAAPWQLNIPQFIEIDLEEKTLSTTKASGQNRSTPFKNLERNEGRITIQGAEGGRAFSFVIDEETGRVSVAVAVENRGVIVFGVCTPMPGSS